VLSVVLEILDVGRVLVDVCGGYPDPQPAREERVDHELTLVNEARVINTFLIN